MLPFFFFHSQTSFPSQLKTSVNNVDGAYRGRSTTVIWKNDTFMITMCMAISSVNVLKTIEYLHCHLWITRRVSGHLFLGHVKSQDTHVFLGEEIRFSLYLSEHNRLLARVVHSFVM